jgi:hypothetical protein
MRVMVLIKANEEYEEGALPSEKFFTEMMAFNERLVKAGVMLEGEGLHASSKGKRVRFHNGKVTVVDGPFAETKELLAGFWIWNVGSMEEAVEWVKQIPNPDNDPENNIEIRPVFEAGGCAEVPADVREKEERLRAEIARKI